jgi:hypothetical protein
VVKGKAIFGVKGLAYGSKTVAVRYEGGDYYEWNSTTGQFRVLKNPSAISATSKDVKYGKDVVVTVSVPNDATGRVLVTIGGVGYYGTIINGKAKVIIPNLPSGKYNAKIVYDGDDKYLPSNTAVRFNVLESSTPISAMGDKIVVGEDASVIVNLPSDATGTVTITVEGKKYVSRVNGGEAKFDVPGLSKGKHFVKVYYSGDKNYPGNQTTATIDVKTSTPISASGDKIEIGSDATVVVKLPKDATGYVTLIIEGKKYTSKVVNGKAVFKIPGLSKGKHTVTVIYSGDRNYAGNETITTIDVEGNDDNGHVIHQEGGVSLSKYSTGNPVWMILLVLFAIVSVQLRRFKK